MKKYKRVLSALLVLLMCVSLFPVSAFAEEEAAAEVAEEVVESVEEAAEPAAEEEPAEEPEPAAGEEPADEEPAEESAEPEVPEEPAEEEIATQSAEEPDEESENDRAISIEPDEDLELALEPHFGTTHYYTAPGVQVKLWFDLPEGISPDGYMFTWYELNENGDIVDELAYMTSDRYCYVSPSVSTRYSVSVSDIPIIWTGGTIGTGEIPSLGGDTIIIGPPISIPIYSLAPIEFYVEVVPATELFSMEQDYIAAAPGDTVTLKTPAAVQPYWAVDYGWMIEDPVPAAGNDGAVISCSSSGEVSAVGEGTAFATFFVGDQDEPLAKHRCRVDVAETTIEDALVTDNYPESVYLPTSKVTANIYSTDYTRFEVLVDLENNQLDAQGMSIDREENPLPNSGNAIVSAWFLEESVSEVFALRVVDDRTLELVPNIDFSAPDYADAVKAVKGSYSSRIAVKLKGVEPLITSNALTLKVKKDLPKVKAAAVKFNSYIAGDQRALSISPAYKAIRLDPSKTQPDWLTVNFDRGTLNYTGEQNGKYKGKLYLIVQQEGCVAEIPVAVAVSAAKTAPKLKVNGTITINPAIQSYVSTTVKVTPAEFTGSRIRITKITEGSTVWSVEDGSLDACPLYCSVYWSGGDMFLSGSNDVHCRIQAGLRNGFDTGKAHTYKVTLDLDGVTTTATVKTKKVAASAAQELIVSGTIDTGILNSYCVVTWPGSSRKPQFRVLEYQGTEEIRDVTDLFLINQFDSNKARVIMKNAESILNGYTYYLDGKPWDNQSNPIDCPMVKLNIKFAKAQAKITTTLKASGTIDLIRPDSAVTIITGPLKNCYNTSGYPVSVSSSQLAFSTDKKGKNPVLPSELPFTVQQRNGWSDGRCQYTVKLKEDARDTILPTDKYYIRVLIPETSYGQEITTKPVQIKLTKGSAKITSTVKSVQLLKNDRFDYANIDVVVPAGLTGIREVTLDAKSAARFALVDNSGGSYELHLNPEKLSTKNATVKLNVFLKGNNTAKPDKTLSVSVKFA